MMFLDFFGRNATFRAFLRDRRGNFAMMTAITMVPLMGALAISIDYAQMSRQRQVALNALDAAGIATARYIAQGAEDADARAFARQFFDANLGSIDPANATLDVTLPNDNTGGGTLKMRASLAYQPYFLPTFHYVLGLGGGPSQLTMSATSDIRLKNTLEVALVLDNSGSMDDDGSGSNKKRIDLLKDAAKKLVDTIAKEAAQMKQVDKPVQFGLVPFAGAVNVGTDNADASWMDTDGLSPIHHENFDWSTMTGNKRVEKGGDGAYYKKGSGWGAEEGQRMTRFTLFDSIMRKSGSGTKHATSWQGCVEMRPYPYALNDTAPSKASPETLFVPMFAPDETDRNDGGWYARPANSNWWPDDMGTSTDDAARQAYMPKYFKVRNVDALDDNEGPNAGCTTKPITPLTDVSTDAGLETIKDAIEDMQPLGSTNVPEGLAWGWRVVSGGAPFTEGRDDKEKGNDKVVIVLTDGANTYYTPDSVQANSYSGSGYRNGGNDLAGNKSIYSNYGYAGKEYDDEGASRIFLGTGGDVDEDTFTNGNYTKAMNDHMTQLCQNAKDTGLVVMTVALDLDSRDTTAAGQIAALKSCASDSRYRSDPDDPTKPAKLFWNATGETLGADFEAIGDELSNLRIVG